MYGIIGLLLLLVAVLTIEVYRATEGFTVANPTPPPAPAKPASAVDAPATPVSAVATPASAVAISAIDALALNTQERAKFLRDIQDIVRTEVLATKQITVANAQPVLSAISVPNATGQISEHQGREAVTAREKACAKDMSQYIRKDSIPCWNCALDY